MNVDGRHSGCVAERMRTRKAFESGGGDFERDGSQTIHLGYLFHSINAHACLQNRSDRWCINGLQPANIGKKGKSVLPALGSGQPSHRCYPILLNKYD